MNIPLLSRYPLASFDELVRSICVGVHRPHITLTENCIYKLLEIQLDRYKKMEAEQTRQMEKKSLSISVVKLFRDESGITLAEADEDSIEDEGEDSETGAGWFSYRATTTLAINIAESVRYNVVVRFRPRLAQVGLDFWIVQQRLKNAFIKKALKSLIIEIEKWCSAYFNDGLSSVLVYCGDICRIGIPSYTFTLTAWTSRC